MTPNEIHEKAGSITSEIKALETKQSKLVEELRELQKNALMVIPTTRFLTSSM